MQLPVQLTYTLHRWKARFEQQQRDERLLDGSPLHLQMCQLYLYLGSSTRVIMYHGMYVCVPEPAFWAVGIARAAVEAVRRPQLELADLNTILCCKLSIKLITHRGPN
jgi:hypothetical protein